jgi:tRNA(fMet)-specific endonuclease VapC
MNGRYLVDSNLWIGLLRNDAQASSHLATLAEVYFCPHVLGELFAGVYKSQLVQANLGQLTALLHQGKRLVTDAATAEQYGQLKEMLRKQGTPIPINDIWIAATAIQHNLTLVTRDSDFDAISQLTKERW